MGSSRNSDRRNGPTRMPSEDGAIRYPATAPVNLSKGESVNAKHQLVKGCNMVPPNVQANLQSITLKDDSPKQFNSTFVSKVASTSKSDSAPFPSTGLTQVAANGINQLGSSASGSAATQPNSGKIRPDPNTFRATIKPSDLSKNPHVEAIGSHQGWDANGSHQSDDFYTTHSSNINNACGTDLNNTCSTDLNNPHTTDGGSPVAQTFSGEARIREESRKRIRTLYLLIFVNVVLTILQLAAGLYSRSLSLLGDAAMMGTDVIGYVVSLVAEKTKTPKKKKRADRVGAAVSFLLLAATTVIILFSCIDRMTQEEIVVVVHAKKITDGKGKGTNSSADTNPYVGAVAVTDTDAASAAADENAAQLPVTDLNTESVDSSKTFSSAAMEDKLDKAGITEAPVLTETEVVTVEQPQVNGAVMVWFTVLNLLLDAVLLRYFQKNVSGTSVSDATEEAADDSMNMSAALAHLVADIARGVSVLVSGLLIWIFHTDSVKTDAYCSFFVSLFIVAGIVHIAKDMCLDFNKARDYAKFDDEVDVTISPVRVVVPVEFGRSALQSEFE